MLFRHILTGSVTSVALLVLTAGGANAQSKIQQLENQIQNLQNSYQNQIQSLQSEIDQLKDEQRQQAAQTVAVQQQAAQAEAEYKKASSGLGGTYHVGGVTLKIGGFIESAGIFRTGNETADVGSNFGNGIPFAANANAGTSETRLSARQSRLSLLAYGQPDDVTKLSAYFESDFLGAAPTANSNESNSYNLRLRQAFAEYDRKDLGFSFVGGQTWSLATLYTSGLYPRNEAVPLTIDAQYNVGFTWMRVPGFRFIENFAPGFWGAISFENPQAIPYTNAGASFPFTVKTGNPGIGGGLLNNGGSTIGNTTASGYAGTSFTFDVMPDIIGKLAWEPGWGHFELFGLAREFRTLITGPAAFAPQQTAFGGGVGFGAILPVAPKLLDVTINGLYGPGVGKYASGQLPDFTINPTNGAPQPITELQGMLGLIGHVLPSVDLYNYLGIEKTYSQSFGTAFGYGNDHYTNLNCLYGNEGGTTAYLGSIVSTTGVGCNISQLWQEQVGGWWNFYKGDFGRMALGASYSYVNVDTFPGTHGAPSTHNNIVMISFRYYPF
jgi:TolA-binding protein